MDTIIGIDFGTSYTYIIQGTTSETGEQTVADIAGDLYGNYVGNRSAVGEYKGIKTILGYDANQPENSDKLWVVGWEAEKALKEQNIYEYNTETNLKKKLRDLASTHNKVEYNKWTEKEKKAWGNTFRKEDGTEFYCPATEMARIFLSNIFRRHIKDDATPIYSSVKKIVVGMPATVGVTESYSKLIKEYVLEPLKNNPPTGISPNLWFNRDTEIEVLEEPILAGCACLQEQGLKDTKYIFVIDIGGGTADYAILEKLQNGKLKVCKFAGGGTEPAGDDIDRALRETILKSYTTVELEDNAITYAKEELFKSKSSLCNGIDNSNLLQRSNNEERNRQIYEDYIKYGRRVWINTFSGPQRIKFRINIAFGIAHKKPNDIDYYLNPRKVDWTIEKDNVGVVTFEDSLNRVIESKFISGEKGIKQFYNDVAKEYNFDAIAFVGGTSNVMELRDKICETLNISKIGGEYINGRAHIIKKDGQERQVKLFFSSETGSDITCSNAVARGALLQQGNRQEVSSLYSKPDIYLQLYDPNNNVLVEDLLFSGSDSNKYKRSYKFQKVYNAFKLDNPDKEFRIKFRIRQDYGGQNGNSQNIYPKKGYFSISLTKDQLVRNLDVLFIAHKMGSGEMHYTGSIKKKEDISDEEKVWGRYCIYVLIDEKISGTRNSNITLCFEFADDTGAPHIVKFKNTRATRREFKCYDIVFSQGDVDGQSKSYGWCSPLNKEGFYDWDKISEKKKVEINNLLKQNLKK